MFPPQLTYLYAPILPMRKNMISSLGTVSCLQSFLSAHLITPSLCHFSSHTFLGALDLHAQDHEMCTVYCERQHCDWHLRDQPVFINLPDQETVLWYPLKELPWADAHTMPGPLLVAGLAAVSPALTPDPSNQPAREALWPLCSSCSLLWSLGR